LKSRFYAANVIASLNIEVKPSPKPILPVGWH